MNPILPGACRGATNFQSTKSTYGDQRYGKEVLEGIKHSGSLELNGTIVRQETKVDGHLHMSYAELNVLKINGMCEANYSEVKGLATINGMLKACQTIFQNMAISTDHLKMDSCTTADITIIPCPNQVNQRITLTNTWVKGSICFENGQGIVEIDKVSRIDGQVSGGQILKK